MSDDLEKVLDALRRKVGDRRPEQSVRFEFVDLGALRLDGQGVRPCDGSDADCTISASYETFRGIFDGNISPTTAFMSGRLRISGDMGVAMRIASLLG